MSTQRRTRSLAAFIGPHRKVRAMPPSLVYSPAHRTTNGTSVVSAVAPHSPAAPAPAVVTAAPLVPRRAGRRAAGPAAAARASTGARSGPLVPAGVV